MDLQTLKLLADYNEKTDQKLNAIIAGLSNEQWMREFGGFFKSIKSMCNHIYICDFNWLMRFSPLRQFNYIDAMINNFVNEIIHDDLNEEIEYTDSHGNMHKKNFGGLVLHMFNHQTHHRGMISICLEEMGIANNCSNPTDLV